MATPNDIYNEITRIDNAKQGIAEAIEEKGVQVPENSKIEEYPELVRQIQQGSPDAVLFTPQDLTPEQQAQARDNIGAGTYTKPNTGIPETELAQSVQTSLEKANTAVQPAALTPITDLIPEQATPQNQLADKNFVNSSIATNTANYISDNGQPFQSLADLQAYSGTLTNNDYAFVVGTDSAGNTTYTRYKYNANTGEWAEEFVLNNSSFTAAQWAAISSGITALLVQKLSDLPTEIVTYVAQTLTEAQKQQARTNIGATAPEIFVAEYGVTTREEIIAAVNDGKIVFVKYLNNIYVGMAINTGPGNTNNFYFSSVDNGSLRSLFLTPAGSWGGPIGFMPENTSNKSQSIETDRESTSKYPSVKAVFDELGKWGVVSQTQTWTGNNNTGYDYTMSNQVWGLIPQANIDLYVNAGAVFNETTGYFELNGLTDISYNEMTEIYKHYSPLNIASLYQNYDSLRTVLPNSGRFFQSNFNNMFSDCLSLEVTPRDKYAYYANGGTYMMFVRCSKLKKIGNVVYRSSNNNGTFTGCSSLESVSIQMLLSNLSFADCPRLTLESVVYAVNNAANTAAITITLHATAYARCQADTTEYTYEGNTYTGIIAYAAAKNITIASA